MNRNRIISVAVAACLALLSVTYVCYGIYTNDISRITTEPVTVSQVDQAVEAKCFVVRDEARLTNAGVNTSVLISSSDGVYVASVSDGARVAANDKVAVCFKSASDAQLFSRLETLDEKLDYYRRLQKQSVLSSVDVGALDNRINSYIGDYVDCLERNELSGLSGIVTEIEHNITTRQLATGTKIDFSSIISSLESQRSALSAKKPSVSFLSTNHAGCFVSAVDGYEKKAVYSEVASLGVKGIDGLISSSPESVPDNVYGKVIGKFEWYAVCTVPDSVLTMISTGSNVTVRFEDAGNLELKMKVKSISDGQDGRLALILSSSVMNEQIAGLRIENVGITLKSYEGYKVSKSALRQNEDGDMGVYILYGNTAKFKKVSIMYYGSNFVMVAPADSSDENNITQLKLHDNIIVKGRDLYDGKLLSQ